MVSQPQSVADSDHPEQLDDYPATLSGAAHGLWSLPELGRLGVSPSCGMSLAVSSWTAPELDSPHTTALQGNTRDREIT